MFAKCNDILIDLTHIVMTLAADKYTMYTERLILFLVYKILTETLTLPTV